MKKINPVKLSIIITDIFFCILIIFTLTLPWIVTWYVEAMHRAASLPATILVTCYPCVPFAAGSLFFLRKLLKNALAGEIFSATSITYLKNLSCCALIIAVITLFAGKFYLPFFIVGATFAFLSLLIFSLKCIFSEAVAKIQQTKETQ